MRAGNQKESAVPSGTQRHTAYGSSGLPNTFSLGNFIRRHGSLSFDLCALVVGAAMIIWAEHQTRRQLQTLQWPTASGTMTQAYMERTGRHDHAIVSYTYQVDDRNYVSDHITLWNLENDTDRVGAFIKEHPARSAVDVHYDPQHPDSAVLLPGYDSTGHVVDLILRWGGIFVTVVVTLDLIERLLLNLGLTKRRVLTAQVPRRPRKPKQTEPDPLTKGKPFLTYEPANKCKLTCFPDKQCLLDFLGHIGESMQDWTPDDRAVDSSGRVFRLVYSPTRKLYNLEPTDETWDHQKILALVIAEGLLTKCTPDALRQRIAAAADAEKIRVILNSMDKIDSPSRRFWISLGFFLLLFGAGVFYLTFRIVNWLSK